MPDHLGYRKIFGVTGPSTNTIVQPDFDDLRPIGVTNHYSRIIIPNMPVNNNEDFLRLVKAIMGETLAAIEVLKSCEMQYLVMGMSATTFWDGRKGAEAYVKQLSEHAGVGVSCGSFATAAALVLMALAGLLSETRAATRSPPSGPECHRCAMRASRWRY